MISKINGWAQGIVIATIIGTVIQLILPESKNKKYIKVIIGIYILFCIIYPVVGKTIDFSKYDLSEYGVNEYFENSTDISKFENDNSFGINTYESSIKSEFKKKIIYDVSEKLKALGYSSKNIDVLFDERYNMTHLKILNISKYDKEYSIVNEINISVHDVNASRNDSGNNDCYDNSLDTRKNSTFNISNKIDEGDSVISKSEKNKIKDYFHEVYKVSKSEIEID